MPCPRPVGTMLYRRPTSSLVALLTIAAYLMSVGNANLDESRIFVSNETQEENETPTTSATISVIASPQLVNNEPATTTLSAKTQLLLRLFKNEGNNTKEIKKFSNATETNQNLRETVRKVTETYPKMTETYLKMEEAGQEVTETEQKVTETDQKVTETDQKVTETDQKVTEIYQKVTETDQKMTETDQEVTEKDQKVNETDQEVTETDQKVNETDQKVNETDQEMTEAYEEVTINEGHEFENETDGGSGINGTSDDTEWLDRNDTLNETRTTELSDVFNETSTMSSTSVSTTHETTSAPTSVHDCPDDLKFNLDALQNSQKINLNWSLLSNHSLVERHDFRFYIHRSVGDNLIYLNDTQQKSMELKILGFGEEPRFCLHAQIKGRLCGQVKCKTVLLVLPQEPKEKNHGESLAIAFVVLVIAVLIAVIAIKSRRRVMNFYYGRMRNRSATAIIMDKLPSSVRPPARVHYNRPIPIAKFDFHFRIMSADSKLKFSVEFEELNSDSPICPYTSALLPENQSKNRWTNILPFDHSRVKLLPIADDLSSDYINANYIPGYTSQREYIATQGPLPHTVDDFWRMIWEQGSSVIVMLTQCVERGKLKCEEYWPSDHEFQYYGDLAICLKSESVLPEYSIRIFDMQLGSRIMEVKQIHFTMWPDFGCPENTQILLDFVKSVRTHIPHYPKGPIVVHCSAGVGRTGTFIAIERLMKHVHDHEEADVFSLVREMRRYRNFMVQTEDQYVYIHECLRDYLQSLNEAPSEISATESQLFLNKSDL